MTNEGKLERNLSLVTQISKHRRLIQKFSEYSICNLTK